MYIVAVFSSNDFYSSHFSVMEWDDAPNRQTPQWESLKSSALIWLLIDLNKSGASQSIGAS